MITEEERTAARKDLALIRELIGDPIHWCQGALARKSADDWSVFVFSPRAAKFCVVGAHQRSHGNRLSMALLNGAAVKLGYMSALILNDSTNHDTVMKMLTGADELAKTVIDENSLYEPLKE